MRAIRHLVASAVNGLKPNRVSVVDENGRLLADGAKDELAGGGIAADERQIAFERRMRDQVESIVSSIVGPGRARVQLTAEFDFNRVTQTSDKFDPEGRVVRSSQTREESSQTADNREGQVTVGNELPGAQQKNQNGENGSKNDQAKKTEEIVNYEISRVTKTETIEGGRVNRISVAVLVDGTYTRNDKGEMVYAPRAKEEVDRIAALVRSAIGFDQKRGDQVEVVNLRLAEAPQNIIAEPKNWLDFLQFTKDDIMRGVELAVMLLLGLDRAADRRASDDPPHCRPREESRGRAGWPRRRRGRPVRAGTVTGAPGGPNVAHQQRRPGDRDHLDPYLADDRHRAGAGPGARPVGAEGRRARREEPARDRRHHPFLAPRRPALIEHRHGRRSNSAKKRRHREPGRDAGEPAGRADRKADARPDRTGARGGDHARARRDNMAARSGPCSTTTNCASSRS